MLKMSFCVYTVHVHVHCIACLFAIYGDPILDVQ